MDKNHRREKQLSRHLESRRWGRGALGIGSGVVAVIVSTNHPANAGAYRSDLLWPWLAGIALVAAVLLPSWPRSVGWNLLPANLIAVVTRPLVLSSVLHDRTPAHSSLGSTAHHPALRHPTRRAGQFTAEVDSPAPTHRYHVVKRAFDLTMVVMLSVVVVPLIPVIALIIKLDSPGPVFYSQLRVGLHGRVFRIYKFRSMRTDAERDGAAVWAQEADPRVTRVGRFLRRARIDELPQLWNVLRGEMAFVGPRPERPEFTSILAMQLPTYELRHSVRPGLTGWAQIRYRYASSVQDSATKLEYDLYYVGHRSLGFDAKILILTISVLLHLRGC